jgi:Fe2+ or Zn2+ uptake regulation protein
LDEKRQRLVELVRSAGLRVTACRVAVLGVLARHPHADTDTVIRHVRAELGSVSTQAVYNVLAAFVDAGLVRRIEPAGSAALYELRVADNHHHVVCRSCGAVADVDCAVGRRPCLTPSDTHGYLLDEAEVVYWGVCPRCLSGSDAVSRPVPSRSRPPGASPKGVLGHHRRGEVPRPASRQVQAGRESTQARRQRGQGGAT